MGSTPDPALAARLDALLARRGPGAPAWHALGAGVGGVRWHVHQGDRDWFLKAGEADVLTAEADGLQALAAAGMRVPRVEACGEADAQGYLLLEWLPLAHSSSGSAARLGEALARLHLQPAPRFGWPRNNFIGATPQFNREGGDWVTFFREQRLGFQLRLAGENGYHGRLQESGARLMAALPALFAGYRPHAALLHGDLWGGNWGALLDGGPVVFDPAVYRGDREADLAMTELFGGFPREFYDAYRLYAALDAGYAVRRDLYQLYHVLNHLNLFGEGYLGQALVLIDRLNSETK